MAGLYARMFDTALKPDGEDGCWIFTGGLTSAGYGLVRFDGRYVVAHRLAYELLVGPIPEGLELDHLCNTKACINPAHLEPVTHTENMRRALRRDHCIRGHLYTDENLYIDPGGHYRCRKCRQLLSQPRKEQS